VNDIKKHHDNKNVRVKMAINKNTGEETQFFLGALLAHKT
jgi:hypothetical protein